MARRELLRVFVVVDARIPLDTSKMMRMGVRGQVIASQESHGVEIFSAREIEGVELLGMKDLPGIRRCQMETAASPGILFQTLCLVFVLVIFVSFGSRFWTIFNVLRIGNCRGGENIYICSILRHLNNRIV